MAGTPPTGVRGARLNSINENQAKQHDSILSPAHPDDVSELRRSRAAFAMHQPEIRHVPEPLTHKEAVKKYRQMETNYMMEHQQKKMRKLGQYTTSSRERKAAARNKSMNISAIGINQYLGTGDMARRPRKKLHMHGTGY